MSLAGTLNGLYKEAYAEGIENLIPPSGKIRKMTDFVPSDRENGKSYNQPVIVSGEQGFTYALDSAGIYSLNDAVGMTMQNAVVPGNDIVLSSAVSYNDAAKGSNSVKAFKTTFGLKLENMMESAVKRLEIGYLYGQSGIAAMAQQTVATTDPLAIIVDAGAWATGIFAGAENAQVMFYVTSTNAYVDSGRSYTINKVDPATRTVYISAGTQGTAGSLGTLETAIEAGALTMFWYGASSGTTSGYASNEQAGLQKQITNSGSLFGIDAAQYNLWKGNPVTVSGQLTMGKVLSAVAQAVQRGLDEKAVVLVNPATWANLASDLAALRMFDGSYSKKQAANGSEELKYYGQNGELEIISYNLVKEGHCFIFPPNRVLRIGAQDLSFNTPGKSEEEIFFQLPTQAGVGLRAYTNQAIFLETPARAVFISGITNAAA